MFFVSLSIVCFFRSGFSLNLVCHRIYSNSAIFVFFPLTNHFVIFFFAFGEICGLLTKGLKSGDNHSAKVSSVSPIRLNTYLSLILFERICLKQSVRYLRIVSPCSEGNCESFCGAIGLRVRLLTEKLVVRVHPGAWGFFSISVVFLFRAGLGLKLVCHRIYSSSTIFVFFRLANHFGIFFCLW